MTRLKMSNGYILVERFNRAHKDKGVSPFVSNVVSQNYGEVLQSEDPELSGKRVYFGPQVETLVVEGKELLAMKSDNLIAIVEGSHGDQTT